jgi:hypothetical protein
MALVARIEGDALVEGSRECGLKIIGLSTQLLP